MICFGRSEAQWSARKAQRQSEQEHAANDRQCGRAGSSQLRSVERARLLSRGTALVSRIQRAPSLRAPAVLAAARPQAGFTTCTAPMILLCTAASENVVVRSSFESVRPECT